MSPKLILHGDWAPGNRNVVLELPEGNYHLANLEGPLLSEDKKLKKAQKAGPNISNKYLPDTKAKFSFTLANNHIMDYGVAGLQNTINSLDQNGIYYSGAGLNKKQARSHLLLTMENNIRIAIVSCCEAQYGVSQLEHPGVAEIGPWIYKKIKALKEQTDYIIVSVHAGSENSPWPIPLHSALYRSFIDSGASIVHGHHSHLPQGWEAYQSGYIFYGLGNFVVDPHKWSLKNNALWSFGAEIDFTNTHLTVTPVTFNIREIGQNIHVSRSSKEEYTQHMKHIEYCNRPLNDPILLNALWQEVSISLFKQWGEEALLPLKGRLAIRRKNRIKESIKASLRILKGNYPQLAFQQKDKIRLYHLFSCTSHREMYKTALGLLTGEIEDLRSEQSQKLISLTLQGE